MLVLGWGCHVSAHHRLHTRGLDHQEDREKDDKTKAMVRHTSVYHQGRECKVDYSKSVVSTHKDPLTRKIRNGVAIISNQQDILLNNKQEFLQGVVPGAACFQPI